MSDSLICVLAKEPRPGFAKTRLSPPFTPAQAAALAAASLADTLEAVADTPVAYRVIALEGASGEWIPDGFDVIAQPAGHLGHRLDAAVTAGFEQHPSGPVIVIGMDTPQVCPADLVAVADLLTAEPEPGAEPADAVVGGTADGGYWVIGFRRPVPGAFDGVPMSSSLTCAAQVTRLTELGCHVVPTAELVDVDDMASAGVVAAAATSTRFARTFARIAGELSR